MNIPGLDGPGWSRTSGIDEQDEAVEEARAAAEWKQKQQQFINSIKFTSSTSSSSAAAVPAAIQCNTFVLGCGLMGASFLRATTSGLRELGRISIETPAAASSSSEDQKKKRALASALTTAKPELILMANADGSIVFGLNYLRVNTADYYDLTEAIFQYVQPKQVLLLDTLTAGAYISSVRPLPCPPLVHRLQTSDWKDTKAVEGVSLLEPPNVVFAYAASVLTKCEVAQIPAVLLISIESRHYQVECYEAFQNGLKSLLSSASSPFASLSHPFQSFLSSDAKDATKQYKSALTALLKEHAYTPDSNSSTRETAAQVQRDNRDAMFY